MSKVYRIKKDADKIIAEDQTVWMGLDVHKRSITAMIVDEETQCHHEKVPYGKSHVEGLVERLPGCEVHAVYEAGRMGYQLLRWLREFDCEAFMTPPNLVPQRPGDHVKTDRRDAKQLADALEAGQLEEVYDLTDQQYADRELLRTRKQLVEHRTDLCQQIKNKLDFHGITPPEGMRANWSETYLQWLESCPSGRFSLDLLLAELVKSYRALDERICKLEEWIEVLAETPRYRGDVELLTSTPGVGVLTAMTFLVELGDVVGRFPSCEKLAGYLGLVPWESSSGEQSQKGGITRAGNRRVRTCLVEAAWRVKTNDPHLSEVYYRLKNARGDNGSQIAIVAVARRLALAFRAMLRDRTTWREPTEAAR